MKLLHTSDWHLGKTLYRHSRATDHDAVLAEIVGVARSFRPDVICHSGDLFDHGRPATEDMVRAGQVLAELGAIAPVVVVCGNHDSPSLFAVFNLLGRLSGHASRVHFVDRLDPNHSVFRFPTANGQTVRLAALPFQHAHQMTDGFGDPSRWGTDYNAQIRGIEASLGSVLMDNLDPRTEFAVFAAHLHVGGAEYCGSERGMHIDETYATDLDHLPSVTYAAFGHLHRPQPLPSKKVTGRFAGSPIALDFGEIYDEKSVVLVEAEPGRPARIETLKLGGGRRLRKFRGTLTDLAAVAPQVGDDLCLLAVETDVHVPTLNEQVRQLLPRATVLQIDPIIAGEEVEIVSADATATEADLDLAGLFAEYLSERGTRRADQATVMQTFTTLIDAVDAGTKAIFPEEALLVTGPAGGAEATR
ncbi:DNA exonuclease SbcCD subunit SbcD [Micromonospora sicca]|uniref:Nuclease SbcCD subunit D n=1 Tax=Micromonospora sicca TaxID=2202420 RepID=A0A317DRH6_9ACTN|nr:exonuclease SbcCD subunit D [Micromonospora sp. 4G51]PWR17288.1 DNA exonuclease SbcCD subunit SbcD [Micromonospora sp. 4G51]